MVDVKFTLCHKGTQAQRHTSTRARNHKGAGKLDRMHSSQGSTGANHKGAHALRPASTKSRQHERAQAQSHNARVKHEPMEAMFALFEQGLRDSRR